MKEKDPSDIILNDEEEEGLGLNNDFLSDKRKLIIHTDAHRKMYYYTRAAHSEISGLGKTKITDTDIIVTDALLFKQECSGAHTALSPEMLARFLVELVRKRQSPKHYKLWWHSHNDFGVMWSGVDEATIKELSKDSQLVSICINKSGEMIARIDTDGATEDLQIIVLPDKYCKMQRQCQQEVKQKVTKEVLSVELFKTKGFDRHSPLTKDGRLVDWDRVYREFFSSHSYKDGDGKLRGI